jgi:hypothetical protein
MSFQQSDFIEIEENATLGSSGVGNNGFIDLEDNSSGLGYLNDYSSLRKTVQQSQQPETPPLTPDGQQPLSSPATLNSEGQASSSPPPPSLEDVDIPDTINWVERAQNEMTDDLNFLGYKPEEVSDRDSYAFVKDQMAFVNNAFETHPDIQMLSQDLSLVPVSLVEKGIRENLGVFATDADVASKLSSYITDEGELNQTGEQIYTALRTQKINSLESYVNVVKSNAYNHAAEQMKFYKSVDEKVSAFKFPSVSAKSESLDLEVFGGEALSKAEVRELRQFMEKDYIAVVDGKQIPEGRTKADVLAENAFFLNPKLRTAFINKVATAAYQKGVSDQMSKLK